MATQGSRLPDNWQPSQDEFAYGVDLGLTIAQIQYAAENMRLWALANSNRSVARKADWHLAFLGWLRREAAKRGMLREPQVSYQDIARELRSDDQRDRDTPDLFAAGNEL